jgi:DNA-directed RNA polymerase subunit F
MVKPVLISEVPISMGEMKKELDKIEKRDEELNFRAQKTKDYLDQFSIMSATKIKELKEKIEGLKIPRLRDQHITKIIDILPKTQEEVTVVLQGYTINVNQDNAKKIASAVVEVVS